MGGVSVNHTGPVVGETKLLAKANLRPLFYCAIAVWGAILYGYDGTYFAGILAMPRFLEDFGTLGPDGYAISSSDQSLLASIVQAGELVGSLAAGFIGQATGRKGAFLGASTLVCLGTVLQLILVGSIPLLTVGRFVLGSGVGVISNATPLYLSEVAPTAIRGAVVSSWQLFLALGQVIGACVDQGTKSIDSTAAYRIPIALNFLIALIIVAGVLIFLPESPRWLVSKHKDEQALASLQKINRDQPDPEAVVDVEYKSFLDSRKEEEELSGTGGWNEMFTVPIERRKLFLVWGILVSQQIGGVQFIFSYTTTFFKSIGLNDEFLVTIIVDVIEVFGVLCSFLLVNRIGRRPLLIYTSIPMFISLFVTGALGTIDNRTETQNRTIAAMICIYVFFFNLAWGPLAWVCASELSAGRNKTRIMSVATASFWLVAWAVTFTLPYLFDNAGLGPQIGWIYGVGTLIALSFVFFCVPETRGRSLEDITEMFEARLPALKWITYETQNERSRVENSLAIVGGGLETSSDVDGSDGDGKLDSKKIVGGQNETTTQDA